MAPRKTIDVRGYSPVDTTHAAEHAVHTFALAARTPARGALRAGRAPVCASHTRRLQSAEHVASSAPSVENTACAAAAVWPASTCAGRPAATSHSCTLPPSAATAASAPSAVSAPDTACARGRVGPGSCSVSEPL